MCRSFKQLRNAEIPAMEEEIRAACDTFKNTFEKMKENANEILLDKSDCTIVDCSMMG